MNPDAVLDEDQKKIRFRKLLLKQQRLWDNGRHDKVHLQDPGNYNDAEAKLDHDDCSFVHDDDGQQKTELTPVDMEQQRQDSFHQSVPSFTQLVCSSYPIQTPDQKQNHSQRQNETQNQSKSQNNIQDVNHTQNYNQNQKLTEIHCLTQLQIQSHKLRQIETEQNQAEDLVPPLLHIEEDNDEDDDFLLKI
jgi:hypothetical protein